MASWTPADGSDHTWVTNMGQLQQGFYNVALATRPIGRELFAVNIAATIKAHGFDEAQLEASLRNAWIALRFHVPGIAVTGDPAARKLYYQPPTTNVKLAEWVDKTFVVMRDTDQPAQLVASDVGTPDLPTLHFFPATSQLLLHSSHWQVDSHGSLMLLDLLLDLAVKPETQFAWGSEVERLQLPLDIVLSDHPGEYSSEVEAFVNGMWAKVLAAGPADVGLRLRNPATAPPGRTLRTGIAFNSKSSAALFAACKSLGLTVTEAVQAAVIMANYKHAAKGQENLPFVAWLARDCRNIVEEDLYRSQIYAAHNFVAMHIMPFDKPKDFESLTKSLAEHLRHEFQPQVFVKSLNKISQSIEEAFLSPKPDGYKPASNMLTSSMAILEKYIKESHTSAPNGTLSVAVDSIYPATELVSAQTILYVFTWKGVLHLEPVFNETWYDVTFLQVVLDTIKTILETELRVELQVAKKED